MDDEQGKGEAKPIMAVRQKFSHGRTRAVTVEVKKPVKRAAVAEPAATRSPAQPPADAPKVRQKFSHGRTRAVTVEVKKPVKRVVELRGFTEEEREARTRALVDANRDAEAARQRAAQEAARRAIEDDERKRRISEATSRGRRVVVKRIYVRDRRLALDQIRVLLTAFEEVGEYNPLRHHNRPPPALWIDDADAQKSYLSDVKDLVAELRKLNEYLVSSAELSSPKPAESVTVIKSAGRKFIESYSDSMGKGAAALSIAVVAALLFNLGVAKEILEPVLAKVGK